MAAIAHIQGKLDTKSLVAHIKQENIRSVKAFEKAGFRYVGPARVKGNECLEYTYITG
jgi:RimJ/RimL family protein N-acetyltransferase